MFDSDHTHLARLRTSANPVDWVGANPIEWLAFVAPSDKSRLAPYLPSASPNRRELLDLCQTADLPLEAIFVTVMAWGGMHRWHGRRAWEKRNRGLVSVMRQVRSGNVSREEGYAAFAKLRRDNLLPGIGPAYFTKLLFFLNPRSKAFIMDQWTSKSINLLFGPTIYLEKGTDRGKDTVSNLNSSDIYADFCEKVEHVGRLLGCDGAEAERLLFSQKRPKEHHWRYYVKTTWSLDAGNALKPRNVVALRLP